MHVYENNFIKIGKHTGDEIVALRRIFVAATVTCHSVVRIRKKKGKERIR